MGYVITAIILLIIVGFAVACFWGREPDVCHRTGKYCGKAEDCECARCDSSVENCKTCSYWNGCTTGGTGG